MHDWILCEKDFEEVRKFFAKYDNPDEPVIMMVLQ